MPLLGSPDPYEPLRFQELQAGGLPYPASFSSDTGLGPQQPPSGLALLPRPCLPPFLQWLCLCKCVQRTASVCATVCMHVCECVCKHVSGMHVYACSVSVCACVCARVGACACKHVRACVCVCARACACASGQQGVRACSAWARVCECVRACASMYMCVPASVGWWACTCVCERVRDAQHS